MGRCVGVSLQGHGYVCFECRGRYCLQLILVTWACQPVLASGRSGFSDFGQHKARASCGRTVLGSLRSPGAWGYVNAADLLRDMGKSEAN